MMSMWAEKILRKEGDDPHKPRVLLMAFTGKAASLIGKLILLHYENNVFHCHKFQME